ncbi:ankyrin repeat-containing domain protein [Naematelia encephala]|uniref:protein S-acyltransferase n=1 Tax=Naematelia encephala TaxID=71784 RepID=A0A1Y2ANL5_9TREE|nr:ankyrin repeat-containing domain protein [Naematelia encephala]
MASTPLPEAMTTTSTPDTPSPSLDSKGLRGLGISSPVIIENDPLRRSSVERPSAEVGQETILDAPPPPDPLNLHIIAQRGDIPTLVSLLDADPTLDISARDDQGITPLHWASINAHIGMCRFLLDHGADVDAVGGELRATPLQWAARNGHLYVVHLLLSRGADPNVVDAQGFNTLHLITHSSAVMPLLYMVSLPTRAENYVMYAK